jgi:hypothetical protein
MIARVRGGARVRRSFEARVVPTGPRSTPPPEPAQVLVASQQIGGEWFRLNLKTLSMIEMKMVAGYDVHCRRGRFVLSSDAEDKANVWKCIAGGYTACFPIGDIRSAVTLDVIGSGETLGFVAMYTRGAEGSSVVFSFHCNPDTDCGVMNVSVMGYQGPNKTMIVFIHTPEVCRETVSGRLDGGAVFLLVVFSFVFVYFAVGIWETPAVTS